MLAVSKSLAHSQESLAHSQESLVHPQGSLVLPHAQQQPHLEVPLAAGPNVEPVAQPLPGVTAVFFFKRKGA